MFPLLTGGLLLTLMSLFLVFGNIKCIEDLYAKYDSQITKRCLLYVWGTTAWKAGLLFSILGAVLSLTMWAEDDPAAAPLWMALMMWFVGALLGGSVGFITGVAAAIGSFRSKSAAQVLASLALMVQLLTLVSSRGFS